MTTTSAVSDSFIALRIRSTDREGLTTVTVSRTATVLQLKQEIQSIYNATAERQRLIFQGRVLRDDKQLTEVANLAAGKVIHLVVRPADAPHNPVNDDPNLGSGRRLPDSSGQRRSNGVFGSRYIGGFQPVTFVGEAVPRQGSEQQYITYNLSSLSNPIISRETTVGDEDTLARTLGTIRNVRNLIMEFDSDTNISATTAIPMDQMLAFRSRLRNTGTTADQQLPLVLDDLAGILMSTAPRLRQVAAELRALTSSQTAVVRNHVENLSRVLQGVNLVAMYMGIATSSIDLEQLQVDNISRDIQNDRRNAGYGSRGIVQSSTRNARQNTTNNSHRSDTFNNSRATSSTNGSRSPTFVGSQSFVRLPSWLEIATRPSDIASRLTNISARSPPTSSTASATLRGANTNNRETSSPSRTRQQSRSFSNWLETSLRDMSVTDATRPTTIYTRSPLSTTLTSHATSVTSSNSRARNEPITLNSGLSGRRCSSPTLTQNASTSHKQKAGFTRISSPLSSSSANASGRIRKRSCEYHLPKQPIKKTKSEVNKNERKEKDNSYGSKGSSSGKKKQD